MINLDVVNFNGKYSIEQLIDVMRALRAPDGCPWDREQDHHSIRNNFLEEAYEAVDAIDRDNIADMREELGDVLMQVIFHAIMEEEQSHFNFDDVVDEVCRKLIYRHPHVFGDVKADTSEKVLDNWEKLKRVEKSQQTFSDTLCSVPVAFPSLIRAQKVQKRAAKAGYDFENVKAAFDKVVEETNETADVINSSDKDLITEEIGDLLFSVVNTARHLGVDSEEALSISTQKFINRFSFAEQQIINDGKEITALSADELDVYWRKAKS
ncbi:MAG: nucleoside triphosphate pyrophosphohydrolase [Acutalibacteraceae bacterium]|nr:nucleoside triphosphate pyrophosphohydrolase [Acutalibacteraceae bacterium]